MLCRSADVTASPNPTPPATKSTVYDGPPFGMYETYVIHRKTPVNCSATEDKLINQQNVNLMLQLACNDAAKELAHVRGRQELEVALTGTHGSE